MVALGHEHIIASGQVSLCGVAVSKVKYARQLPQCGWCRIASGAGHWSTLKRPKPMTTMVAPRKPAGSQPKVMTRKIYTAG